MEPKPSYQIIKADFTDMEYFEDMVDDAMQDGWKPLGGPFVRKGAMGDTILQAMITDDQIEPAPIAITRSL